VETSTAAAVDKVVAAPVVRAVAVLVDKAEEDNPLSPKEETQVGQTFRI
jgi:hypothetical protein